VDTGKIAPVDRGNPADLKIGERGLAFNVEGERVRAIGGVDISGKHIDPIYGPRISFAPGLGPAVAGSPLLTLKGGVAAVIGGSRTQGARLTSLSSRARGLNVIGTQNESVPLGVLEEKAGLQPVSLADLLARGTLTPSVQEVPELVYAGTTRDLPKDMQTSMGPDATEFSSKDRQVFVYALWQRRNKVSKGMMGGVVSDVLNRPVVRIEPKKISFRSEAPTRAATSFSPANINPGVYRIDLLFENKVCWRGFIRIRD
jgi:hypothetical protein